MQTVAQNSQAGATPPDGLKKLDFIKTHTATPSSIYLEQVRKSMGRGLPWMHSLKGFKERKSHLEKIALVGGGPSINNQKENIRDFEGLVIACGSSHDWLVNNNIPFDICILCDPDKITANYVTKPKRDVVYFVATQCHDKVFDTLQNNLMVLWHCFNDEFEKFKEIDPEFQAVGGGCTVGLRALSIVLMFGYSNIHFFGFDSSLGEYDAHHAYNFTDASEQLGEIYEIRLGYEQPNQETTNIHNKVYRCAGYQLAQAQHFKEFYAHYSYMFTPTFHGDGLLPSLWRLISEQAEKIAKGKIK